MFWLILLMLAGGDFIGGWGSWGPVEPSSAGAYDLENGCLYFYLSGDPDTYLCRTGADEVTLTVGGVNALVCDGSYCTFASGPMIGASIPFADAAGVLTLQNVDAIDATTETTIEAAIDSLTLSSLTMAGNPDFAGYDAYNIDDLVCEPPATDVAPRDSVIATQPVSTIPGATNVSGSSLILAPSPGENTLEGVTKAGSTGDTLTFTVCKQGVCANTVKTEGAASPDGWDCDGAASDILCVCNLYDLLVGAGAISGVDVARTDATCSDEKLTFNVDPGVSEYVYVATSDDTNVDMTQGTGGFVVLTGHADMRGRRLYFDYANDPDTYIYTDNSNDRVKFFIGGGVIAFVESGAADYLDLTTFRPYSSSGAMNFGGLATTSHALATGSSIFGVDAGGKCAEFNGVTYFDAATYFYGNQTMEDDFGFVLGTSSDASLFYNVSWSNPDTLTMGLPATSNNLTICEKADQATDFGLAKPANPVFNFQSADATKTYQGNLVSYAGAVTRDHATAADSHSVTYGTGDNTNAGDYDTGSVTIKSGATTTDGDTGDINLVTGLAGAGAADAGDIFLKTHSTIVGASVLGATGAFDILRLPAGDLTAGSCTAGQVSFDTGGAAKELCFCTATNNWDCITVTTLNGPAD